MSAKKTILIVDDEREFIPLVEVRLSSKGYRVLSAFDGAEGLKKAMKEHPDCILLDVMMPKMDGYEVLQSLKADPSTHSIPVIMLTARGLEEDKEKGESLGVDAYITKPFDNDILTQTIEKLLG